MGYSKLSTYVVPLVFLLKNLVSDHETVILHVQITVFTLPLIQVLCVLDALRFEQLLSFPQMARNFLDLLLAKSKVLLQYHFGCRHLSHFGCIREKKRQTERLEREYLLRGEKTKLTFAFSFAQLLGEEPYVFVLELHLVLEVFVHGFQVLKPALQIIGGSLLALHLRLCLRIRNGCIGGLFL